MSGSTIVGYARNEAWEDRSREVVQIKIIYLYMNKCLLYFLRYELGLAVDGLVDGVLDCIDDVVELHIAMINQAKDARE
jgi:hypothetical protein